MQQNTNMQEKTVTAYDLWSFLIEIEKAIKEGYQLSPANQHFPQAMIGFYTCTLVREEKKVVEMATNVAEVPTLLPAKDDTKTQEVKESLGAKPKGTRAKKVQ